MPGQTINTHYQIPQQRGDLNAYQPDLDDPRFAQQTSARLQLQQVYRSQVNARPAEATVTPEHLRGAPQHPTFSQVEPFLYEVGDWIAFNRKEVTNNGWIS